MELKNFAHSSRLTVGAEHTARAMGSGDLDVLATPALVALMENAAMLAVAPALQESDTTVGGHIEVDHLRPTAVGHEVTATAHVVEVDGAKIAFEVSAVDDRGREIARGRHMRYIVGRKKFLAKL